MVHTNIKSYTKLDFWKFSLNLIYREYQNRYKNVRTLFINQKYVFPWFIKNVFISIILQNTVTQKKKNLINRKKLKKYVFL